MPARSILLGLALVIPFWIAVVRGGAQLREAASRGELPAMPWSNR